MERIPTKELSGRSLITVLRDLVDKVSDPRFRYRHPDEFAISYHELISIVKNNPKSFQLPSVKHNLGDKRMDYIEKLLGDE